MSYIDGMQARAFEALDRLFEGVTEVIYTDFPDYNNVGDSAIAVGQQHYLAERGIAVREVYSAPTLDPSVFGSRTPVLLQGGGNFGGLYPVFSEHRYRLAERLPEATPLLQAPQSVHFTSAATKQEFVVRMAARRSLRIAVRDRASLHEIQSATPQALLAPDCVHVLGHLRAPAPSQPFIVLARRDDESADPHHQNNWVDWRRDPASLAVTSYLGWKSTRVPALRRALRKAPNRWAARAERRLQLGITRLAPGETIVTDRLHAMLIGLQMGRRVIAVDNNNQKLANYASAWFADLKPNLEFAPSLADAVERV